MFIENVADRFFKNEDREYNTKLIMEPPLHTKLEVERILDILRSRKKLKKVADFGAGTGRLTIPILKMGLNVIAVDISSNSLKKMKNLANLLKLNVKTAKTLEVYRPYSAVVGCDILHHINLDKELTIVYESLVKKGIVVFSEPNAFNISWYLYFLLKRIWKHEKGIKNCNYLNLRKKFSEVGFKHIDIVGLGFFPRPLFKLEAFCRLNDWIGNLPLLKYFSYRFIISASKN